MPSARRSTGCLLCVQRRVKCDERVPGCMRCETYGKACPGYDRAFKFVPGKPYRTPRRAKLQDDQQDVDAAWARASQALDQSLARKSSPVSLMSPNLNVIQNLDILISDLASPFPTSSTYTVSRWLRFLPVVYGRNRTLDATVRCFVAHHIGHMTTNMQALRYARSSYVEALNGLQRSLIHPVESTSAEVLCAVLLQCMYELFANKNDSISWMKHAKGLGQLIKFRGCDRYHEEFDYNLLKASRGLIIMHSVFSGEECFLASDDWHAVMKQRFDKALTAEFHAHVEDLFASFTTVPRLIHDLFDIRTADMTSPATQLKVSKVVAETLAMQKELEAWYDQFIQAVSLPREAPSARGDTLFPIVYLFTNVDVASIYCAYYSYMVVIHEILSTCGFGPAGDHKARVIYFRDQICKSVEYNARGLLGPYRLGFPLRVAYEVADPVTKAWIEGWLHQLAKHYAALLPRNFT